MRAVKEVLCYLTGFKVFRVFGESSFKAAFCSTNLFFITTWASDFIDYVVA